MNSQAEIIELPQENQFKIVKFELTPEAITEMVKEYESLSITPGDKESYQTVHQAKMVCVKARTGTDKRRKELGSDARQWISDVNSKAQELIGPLLPLEEKLKAMLDEEDQREAKIEQARLEKIHGLMVDIDLIIQSGMGYDITSGVIQKAITTLTNYKISAVDFEERTEQAEAEKAAGLETLNRILADRIKWETDQAEAAKVKAEQEAEAKKLAQEKAEFEAARIAEREKQAEIQAKLDLEREVKEKEAAKIAAQEAEKIRLEREQLDRDRKAMEDQQQAIKAEENRIAFEKYSNEYDEATAINWTIIPDSAMEMNADFNRAAAEDEAARIEKLSAENARAELVAQDKKEITIIADAMGVFESEIVIPEFKTKEAGLLVARTVEVRKIAIMSLEKAGRKLI